MVRPYVRVDLVVGEAGEEGNSVPKASLGVVNRGRVKANLAKEFPKFITFFSELFRFRELLVRGGSCGCNGGETDGDGTKITDLLARVLQKCFGSFDSKNGVLKFLKLTV